MKLTLDLVSSNRVMLILLAVSSMAGGMLSAAFLIIVTQALSNKTPLLAIPYPVLFVACSSAILVFRHAHRYIATKVASRITMQLRVSLTTVILSCSTAWLDQQGKARLLAIMTNDIEKISAFVLSVPMLLSNVSLFVGTVAYLTYISSWLMSFFMLAVVWLGFLLYMRTVRSSIPTYRRIRQQHGKILGHLNDLVSGYKELKMNPHLRGSFLDNYIKSASQRLEKMRLDANVSHSTGMNYTQALIYVMIGVVIFVFPHLMVSKTEVLLGYVLAIIYISNPLESVINSYPIFIAARPAINNIAQLQHELSGVRETHAQGPDKGELEPSFEEIELVNVSFKYLESEVSAQIGPVNLKITRGETVFVVGGNGSGKTTLIKLFCGLYLPTAGRLLLNGHELKPEELRNYRGMFGVVFSDFHILASVGAWYRSEYPIDPKLLSEFGLEKTTRDGYLTLQQKLSQGERRKFSLLRALAEDRQVFVFDEPGADLDPAFKRFFYTELLPRLRHQKKTVIIVTHDENYFTFMGRMITLANGQIISDETHEN